MKRLLIAYVLTGLVFIPLDLLWLRTVGESFYRPRLGDLIAENFNLAAGIAFYVIYLGGVMFFAVQPALAGGSWRIALVHGALFGLVAYATYDLTNMATLRQWSWAVSIVDILWGAFVTGAASVVAYGVTSRLIQAA